MNRNNQIFVPKRARIKVLTVCHGLHRGIVATLASLRENCFWPGIRRDAENFVKNCSICCFAKPKFLPPSIDEPLMTKAPMEILAFDYIGPLPESNGFRYILTTINLFARYAFAFAVKDLSAEILIVKCKEIVSLVGLPECVLSDRDAQFVSFEFCNFLSKFNVTVRKMSTNAYSPSSNGCSERFNATLQKNISSYLTQMRFPRYSWTKALPTALLSYRSTVHTTTRCCLLYTSPSPRDGLLSRMPSSA